MNILKNVILQAFCGIFAVLSSDSVDRNYLVVVTPDTSMTSGMLSRYRNIEAWGSIPDFNAFRATLSPSELTSLRSEPFVSYVEEDKPVYAVGDLSCPNTQIGAQSWGQGRVTGYNSTSSFLYDKLWGDGVDLYVIDTGVNCEHEEFEKCSCGPSFAGGVDGCTDGNSHGSFCASIAAGKLYGIAKSAHVIGVKVLSDSGMGATSGVIAGMNYVAEQTGNRVASMSLGGGYSQASNDAADALSRSGVALAIAAGNSNANTCNFSPASARFPITVAATDKRDSRAYYSNYGACADIFAPGSDITGASNTPGQYVIGSGTSMATPHVAGVLAAKRGIYSASAPLDLKREIISEALESVVSDAGVDTPNLLLHINCE